MNKWNDESLYHFLKKLGLSNREAEVGKQLLLHDSEKEIARSMNISKDTVHTHKTRIFSKTNIHSRADFIIFLNGNGLQN